MKNENIIPCPLTHTHTHTQSGAVDACACDRTFSFVRADSSAR